MITTKWILAEQSGDRSSRVICMGSPGCRQQWCTSTRITPTSRALSPSFSFHALASTTALIRISGYGNRVPWGDRLVSAARGWCRRGRRPHPCFWNLGRSHSGARLRGPPIPLWAPLQKASSREPAHMSSIMRSSGLASLSTISASKSIT